MLTRTLPAAVLLFSASPLYAQNGWFQPSLLARSEVHKALQSVDERAADIVEEWIRLVETPAPSGKEQARARYMRAEMQKLGLSEIRTDDLFNVSGVRKGTGGGPTVVFAAQDADANDSNIAVSTVVEYMPHRLEEYAEASSIVPGIKSLIALAVALADH
jgi:hypothetical protein